MFAGLKEKLADKLAEFKGATTPLDPLDKHIGELVDKATSDELIAPDWAQNFSVVDWVNSSPALHSGKALKAIKRTLAKPNIKVQLLSLTLLETCVKNSTAEFHTQLAGSEVWADITRLASDSSIGRVDAEVRDKMLGMVEDFARALQPGQFRATYEGLLDRGVDFPVRGTDDAVPILTPPAPPHAAAAAAPTGDAAAAAGAVEPAAAAAAAAAGGEGVADPLAGVDEQDRAAIAAALAEMEAEDAAAAEAERVAAAADAAEAAARQQAQQAAALAAAQAQQAQQAAAREAAEAASAMSLLAAAEQAAAAPPPPPPAEGAFPSVGLVMDDDGPEQQQQQQQQPQPQQAVVAGSGTAAALAAVAEAERESPEQRTARLLETASNSTLLLSEMLACVPEAEPTSVREPYVAELADTCVRLRSRLERELGSLADEALMASALSQHEELSRVLARYEELLAAAESISPTVPTNSATVAAAPTALHPGGGGGGGEYGAPQAAAAGAGHSSAAVPPGQKVSQTAASVAATLKEKFTGAFDKLRAAAAAARSPTAAQPGPGGAADPTSPSSAGPHTGLLAAGDAGSGHFTLLDEEEDEEGGGEGAALLTKRASQQQQQHAVVPQQQQPLPYQAAAAPSYQPPPAPPPPQMDSYQPSLTSLTSAPPSGPAPDLINFEEEAVGSPALQQHSSSGAQTAAAAGALPPTELLAGLTVAAPPAPAPAAAAASPPAAAPAAPAGVSRSGSHGNADLFIEALDRLVSADSVTAPGAAGRASAGGAAPGGGAGLPEGAAAAQQ